MRYYLCLGSNLQNPSLQLDQAISALKAQAEIRLIRLSSRLQTKAYGYTEQPDFHNQILEVESSLVPQILLQRLLDIEQAMGRVRKTKWGPRIIDIDILLADDLVLDTRTLGDKADLPELILPHPDLHNRLFVLSLLCELIPNALHPIMHKSYSELYYQLRNPGGTQ